MSAASPGRMSTDQVRAQDAGHRERQALLRWWDQEPRAKPFWWHLERVLYDARLDAFVFPDGTRVEVRDCPPAPEAR